MPFPWQRFFLTTTLTALAAAPVLARPAPLIWEKIHLLHTLPSVVFSRLGLTHSTRNGYTRDGKRGVPDPTFPPGLTDVVPYDTDRLLLVRGTVSGLDSFRLRVQAADVPITPLRLHTELARRTGDSEELLGAQDWDAKPDGVPFQISLGGGDAARVYQIKLRADTDNTYWVGCRVSLPLPPAPTTPAPATVFVPERVWTDQDSRRTRVGTVVTYQDTAANRQAASRKLGTTGADTPDDYVLRVTLLPQPAAPTTPPVPAAPPPAPVEPPPTPPAMPPGLP